MRKAGFFMSILITSIFMFFSSCGFTKDKVSVEAYMKFVDDKVNGLVQTIEKDSFSLEVFYRPKEFVALSNAGYLINDLNVFQIDSMLKNTEPLQYITINLGSINKKSEVLTTNITDMREFYSRLGYLNGAIKDDVYLISGNDTSRCIMHHFQRNFKMTYYNTLFFAFPEKEVKEDLRFVLNDRVFKMGSVEVTFSKRNLNNIPSISL